MIIDSLPTLTTPTTGDELPIERGQATYKVTLENLATGINGVTGIQAGTITAGTKCTIQYSQSLKIGALGFVSLRAVVNSGNTLNNSDVIGTCSIKPNGQTGALAVVLTPSGSSVSNIYPSLGRIDVNGNIYQGVSSSVAAGTAINILIAFKAQ